MSPEVATGEFDNERLNKPVAVSRCFEWQPNPERSKAVEVVGNFGAEDALGMLDSDDFVVLWAAVNILDQEDVSIPAENSERLLKSAEIVFSKAINTGTWQMVARILRKAGPGAAILLEKIIERTKSYQPEVSVEARRSLLAVQAETVEDKLTFLEEIINGYHVGERMAAIWLIGELRLGKGRRILQQILMDEEEVSFVKKEAEVALARLDGLEATKGPDQLERNPAFSYNVFLSSEPLLATPHHEILAKKLTSAKQLFNRFAEDVGSDFIGLTLHGSVGKGYADESSDIDITVIGKEGDAMERVWGKDTEERVWGKDTELDLTHLLYHQFFGVDDNLQPDGTRHDMTYFNPLFQGLFFGEPALLRQIQKNYLNTVSEPEWEKDRLTILAKETDIAKAAKRFNLSQAEVQKATLLIGLTRVPPRLDEMKKLFL